MERRGFLKTLSEGLAALAAGSALTNPSRSLGQTSGVVEAPNDSAPFDRGTPARVRKAVKFHMLEVEASVQERFRILRDVGFEGVELQSPNEYDTEALVNAQKETDLEVIGVVAGWKHFGSNDPNVLKQSHDELDTALQDASDYGASLVLLVPETIDSDMPYDQAYEQSINEIAKVLPRAAELGVQIGIENVWNHFLLSPLEFASYVDAFESEWLGAYFDVGNVVKLGWPEQWIRVLGDRILRLDVKGFSRERMSKHGPGAGFEADIGDGSIDWEAVRTALDEIGYQGWATAEETGGDVDRMREIAAHMDQVLPTG